MTKARLTAALLLLSTALSAGMGRDKHHTRLPHGKTNQPTAGSGSSNGKLR